MVGVSKNGKNKKDIDSIVIDIKADLNFEDNNERVVTLQSYYYDVKHDLTGALISFKYELNNRFAEIATFEAAVKKVNDTTLTELDLLKVETELDIATIDSKIKDITKNYKFFKNESGFLEKQLQEGNLVFDVSGLTEDTNENILKKEIYGYYKNYLTKTCTTLAKTICEVVAEYK